MTKLTAAQTTAIVTYLREVQLTSEALKGGNHEKTILEILADALESGMELDEIRAGLASRALVEVFTGGPSRAGLCGGLIAGLNMVERVLANAPSIADRFQD